MENGKIPEETVMDLSQIKGKEGGGGVDMTQFDKKPVKIASAEVVQVPSTFSATGKQWVLKVQSEVITTVGEGDSSFEVRASELFNLIQDETGKLTGFPTGEMSNLGAFTKDLGIPNEALIDTGLDQLKSAIVGKETITKAYDKESVVDGKPQKRTYLKFRY